MLMKLLKKTLKSLKKKFNLNKILNKIGEDDDNDDKKYLNLNFLLVEKIQSLTNIFQILVLQVII